MHYPSQRVSVLFRSSAAVMVFTFSVAGPTVVLLSSRIAPQPLLILTFALANSLEVLHETSPRHGYSASVLTCICVFIFFRRKQHQKVAGMVPVFRSAQGRTTLTPWEQAARPPPRAWLLQPESRQVPQLQLHSS